MDSPYQDNSINITSGSAEYEAGNPIDFYISWKNVPNGSIIFISAASLDSAKSPPLKADGALDISDDGSGKWYIPAGGSGSTALTWKGRGILRAFGGRVSLRDIPLDSGRYDVTFSLYGPVDDRLDKGKIVRERPWGRSRPLISRSTIRLKIIGRD